MPGKSGICRRQCGPLAREAGDVFNLTRAAGGCHMQISGDGGEAQRPAIVKGLCGMIADARLAIYIASRSI